MKNTHTSPAAARGPADHEVRDQIVAAAAEDRVDAAGHQRIQQRGVGALHHGRHLHVGVDGGNGLLYRERLGHERCA